VIALGDPHRATGDGPGGPGWLSRLLEWQSHATDTETFWTELRDELAQDAEITVYCAALGTAPASGGGALPLPAGATCIDAAYAQYGEAAHRCIGVRVNGRLTALSTELQDGDALQLFMEPAAGTVPSGPSPEWLEHARTPSARIAIRQWLKAHPAAPEPEPEPSLVGGRVTRRAEVRGEAPVGARAARRRECDRGAGAVEGASSVVADDPHAVVRLAGCCTPVPPDGVTGFAVRGGTVTVHRENCHSVARMTATGRRQVPVRWEQGAAGAAGCRVTLRAEALGRTHLLADLTEIIAAQGATVVSAEVEPPREQRVLHTYTLELPDAAGLPALMRAMRGVPGVYDVTRAARQVSAR
jgi:GTP pyrophosphokinase